MSRLEQEIYMKNIIKEKKSNSADPLTKESLCLGDLESKKKSLGDQLYSVFLKKKNIPF